VPASGTDSEKEAPWQIVPKAGVVINLFGSAFQVTSVAVLLVQPPLVTVYEMVVVPGPLVDTKPDELTAIEGLLLAQVPPEVPLVLSWVVAVPKVLKQRVVLPLMVPALGELSTSTRVKTLDAQP
jgi:hypothetical protein